MLSYVRHRQITYVRHRKNNVCYVFTGNTVSLCCVSTSKNGVSATSDYM